MADNNLPIIEPTIDFTKVPPIHQKRTISFINHFVVNTVSFLNKLALNCEEKLFEFENKLQRVEAAVVILESRLASIPSSEGKLPAGSNPSVPNGQDAVSVKNAPSEEMTNNTDETDKATVTNPDFNRDLNIAQWQRLADSDPLISDHHQHNANSPFRGPEG